MAGSPANRCGTTSPPCSATSQTPYGVATEWKRANPPSQTIEELSQRALLLSFSGRTDDEVAAELGLSASRMADFRAHWNRHKQERLDDDE